MDKEKAIEKIAKVKQLAEKGVGGEKEDAKRLCKELIKKYGITMEDVKAFEQGEADEIARSKADIIGLSIALGIIANCLEDERTECEMCGRYGSEYCKECPTQKNIEDLCLQYETLKRKLEK